MEDLIGIIIRALVIYLYVLTLVRLSGKRTIGSASALDFVVAFIIGDMFDDVIWAEVALAKGIVGISTIVLLHLLITYGQYRWPQFDRLVGGRSVTVVREGSFDEQGLRHEHMREEEALSQLRMMGADQLDEIKQANVEPSGQVSVLQRNEAKPAQKRDLPMLKEMLG